MSLRACGTRPQRHQKGLAMRLRLPTALLGLAMSLAASPVMAGTYFVTSSTGTQELAIDTNNSPSWTFTSLPPYSSVRGLVFALKPDPVPGTTFGIAAEFYDVTNTSVMGVATLTIDDFTTGGEVDPFYRRAVFNVNTAMSTGDQYRITLSLVGDPQDNSGGYRIRGTLDTLFFDDTEVAEDVLLAIDSVTATTEPQAALVLATGLLGIVATRRRAPAQVRSAA